MEFERVSEAGGYVYEAFAGAGAAELCILILLGTALLVAGWRVYRLSLVLSGLVFGGMAGLSLGLALEFHPFMTAVIAGVICGACALPMARIFMFLLCGCLGAIVVMPIMTHFFGEELWILWAVVGFAAMGLLAFIFFKKVIIILTSLEGAFVITFGIYFLFLQVTNGTAGSSLSATPLAILAVVPALAFTGILIQASLDRRRLLAEEKK